MALSPPTSNVRMMTSFPAMVWETALYASYCTVSSGRLARFIKRNSVRNNPMPSAPDCAAASASAGEPMLAYRPYRLPSASTVAWSR